MQIIQNNPYRTVGLLVGATAREKDKQIRRLRQFLDAEQDIQDDFSFPALGNFRRTVESVDDAASKLNLDSDKMFAALFWFYKGNPISDEPALDFLKEAAQQNSIEIWSKLTNTGEVTQRNSSAFQNLSTLLLYNAFSGAVINTNILEKAVQLKLQFIESDFIKDFKNIATDETYKTTKKEMQHLFLNQVQLEIGLNGGISANKFLEIINKQEFSAKEEYLKKFVLKQLQDISKEIDNSFKARKNSAATAHETGKLLVTKTKTDILFLKSVLGQSNFQYQNIADKLSYEVVQCGIDHFNATQEDEVFLSEYEFALNIAITPKARERAEENLRTCKEEILRKQRLRSNPTPTYRPVTSSNSTNTFKPIPTSSSSTDFDFSANAWWLLGLIGLVLGAIVGGGAGAFVGAMLGGGLGSKISKS